MNASTEFRLGIITDTHYWQRSEPFITSEGAVQLQPWSEQILDVLVHDLHAARLDLIIHLGDLVCGGGGYKMPGDEFVQSMRYVHRRLQELDVPVVALPGNHDLHPGEGHLHEFYALWDYPENDIGKTVDLPHVRFVLLNAMGHTPEQIQRAPDRDPVYGMVSPAEFKRLQNVLLSADDRPVLMFSHQVVLPWNSGKPWKEYYGVHNGQEILNLIDQARCVCAVFQGHAHRLHVQERVLQSGRRCVFATLPGTIEYPVAWTQLLLKGTQAHFQLQRLPLPDISAISARIGGGQFWREGDPAWWNYQFDLDA